FPEPRRRRHFVQTIVLIPVTGGSAHLPQANHPRRLPRTARHLTGRRRWPFAHPPRVVCLRQRKDAATPTPVAHDRSFLAIALAPLGGLNADPSRIHPSFSRARRISEAPKVPHFVCVVVICFQ